MGSSLAAVLFILHFTFYFSGTSSSANALFCFVLLLFFVLSESCQTDNRLVHSGPFFLQIEKSSTHVFLLAMVMKCVSADNNATALTFHRQHSGRQQQNWLLGRLLVFCLFKLVKNDIREQCALLLMIPVIRKERESTALLTAISIVLLCLLWVSLMQTTWYTWTICVDWGKKTW